MVHLELKVKLFPVFSKNRIFLLVYPARHSVAKLVTLVRLPNLDVNTERSAPIQNVPIVIIALLIVCKVKLDRQGDLNFVLLDLALPTELKCVQGNTLA